MPPGQTLDGVGRLAERERPGCGCAHQCRTRSLSARSAHPPLSRAASPAPLARRNVGLDMQSGVCMAGRSASFRGEEQGLTLHSLFLTFHACDCCKLARETRCCLIEDDNITLHFGLGSLDCSTFGYCLLTIKTVSPWREETKYSSSWSRCAGTRCGVKPCQGGKKEGHVTGSIVIRSST